MITPDDDGQQPNLTPRGEAADVSVIVPTRNEAGNIAPLTARLTKALHGLRAEVIFVDDSDDATPQVIGQVAAEAALPVRLIHRTAPEGGLSGAVVAGLAASDAPWCVVMDGDLQHPPELVPALVARGHADAADVVVASRHRPGGSTTGLDGRLRRTVSEASTWLARGLFPHRLHGCTDPMSGFFAVRRDRLRLDAMHPRGFKILLEILARHELVVTEEPFVFGVRSSGHSKASLGQGMRFAVQLAALRFGRLSEFGVIGAVGAVLNLVIMAGLIRAGMWYLPAAIIGGAVTIAVNFALQEWLVFRDLRDGAHGFTGRLTRSAGFDTAETTLRTAVLWLVVRFLFWPSVAVQALLLCVGFVARYAYRSLVVYRRSDLALEAATIDDRPPVEAAR
ncbi:MAG TPA: glycosyltransferase [Microbacteriaceae bacterium]|nr:glycosyltransferase [Microbacteriaceae bacterium]